MMEYPEILYVKKEVMYDGCYESGPLIGSEYVESRIPFGGKPTIVAVYKLVRLETYKKTETREIKVEKI